MEPGEGLFLAATNKCFGSSGINWLASELTAKRLELLHELVPGAAGIALLRFIRSTRRAQHDRRGKFDIARSMASSRCSMTPMRATGVAGLWVGQSVLSSSPACAT